MALAAGCRSSTRGCSLASSFSNSTAKPSACSDSSHLQVLGGVYQGVRRRWCARGGAQEVVRTLCHIHTHTAYTGLQVDIDRIRAENEAKTDVERKSGLIIWSGRTCVVMLWGGSRVRIRHVRVYTHTCNSLPTTANPTKAMKDAWRKEAQQKYDWGNTLFCAV